MYVLRRLWQYVIREQIFKPIQQSNTGAVICKPIQSGNKVINRWNLGWWSTNVGGGVADGVEFEGKEKYYIYLRYDKIK